MLDAPSDISSLRFCRSCTSRMLLECSHKLIHVYWTYTALRACSYGRVVRAVRLLLSMMESISIGRRPAGLFRCLLEEGVNVHSYLPHLDSPLFLAIYGLTTATMEDYKPEVYEDKSIEPEVSEESRGPPPTRLQKHLAKITFFLTRWGVETNGYAEAFFSIRVLSNSCTFDF